MKSAGLLLGICLALTTACVSTPLKFPSAPIGPNEKALGKTEATSTGIMLFGFIPINQNTRFEDAMRGSRRESRWNEADGCHHLRTMVLGVGA